MGTQLANFYRQSINLAVSTARRLKSEGLIILAPSFYPARLRSTVEFLAQNGVKVIMAGGGPGSNVVENVPHFKLKYDTTGLDETDENIKNILSKVPLSAIPSKIGMLLYNSATEGDKIWQKNAEEIFSTRVVCSNEQNLTSYFEEKTNLVDILTKAGLKAYSIPSEIIKEDKSLIELALLYKRLKSENGRAVIQSCGPNVSEIGGGHSTRVVGNFIDFCKAYKEMKGYLKVATFVEGVNSNVSICAGNTLANVSGFGALRGELNPTESRYSEKTLDRLIERCGQMGINDNNIFCFVQPGTLKLVGDTHLTTCSTNGVGNQLNYSFPEKTLEDIYSISHKLGKFMAKCGKVGLLGIDLIITKDGHIYINEINDRQQGPTENSSLNNERNNLPGILRMGFLQNYANFNDTQVVEFFKNINEHSKEIYDETLKIKSPYYLKLAGEKVSRPSAVSLSSGTYMVSKSDDGQYKWDLSKSSGVDECKVVDLSKKKEYIKLSDVFLTKGEIIEPDRQVLRINGLDDGNGPFCIVDGSSRLKEEWVPVIKGLKQEIYGTENPNEQLEDGASEEQ